MTTDQHTSFAATLDTLHALKLITRRQRDAALVHAELPQLAAATDLPDTLMWLYLRQVVSHEDLRSLSLGVERNLERNVESNDAGDAAERQQSVLRAMFATVNLVVIDKLHEEGVIDQPLRTAALATMPADVLFHTPGDALAWMVDAGLLTRPQWTQLRQRVASDNNDGPKQIVDYAVARLALQHSATRGAALDALLPGPRLAWIIGVPLAIAAVVWYAISGNAVPACDAPDTLASVTRMLNQPPSVSALDRILGGEAATAPAKASSIKLHDIKQAGYAAPKKIRGCLAIVEQDGEKMEYAYTIASTHSDNKTRIAYTGAQPLLVKARFGTIVDDGDFVQQAAPIGRDALEQAFRAGMDAVRGAPPPKPGFSLTESSDRRREIAEIEPLAPCRESAPGLYMCRLLIERNGGILSLIRGGGAVMQEGDFTFQRGADGKTWSMTPQFGVELRKAELKD